MTEGRRLLDTVHGRLEFVNAGHEYPLLLRGDGDSEELDRGGTVLGLMEDARYEAGSVRLASGDTLVCFSDGVTDRVDAAGEPYGAARLRQAALRSRNDPARIALYSLLGEVQGWSDGLPAEDDATLLIAKRA